MNTEFFTEQGWMLFTSRRFPEARALIENALLNSPQDIDLLLTLGQVMVEMGDFGEGLEMYRAAQSFQPQNPAPYSLMASAYRILGQNAQAIDALNDSLMRETNDLDRKIVRGRIAALEGDFDTSISLLTAATENPKFFDSLSPVTTLSNLAYGLIITQQCGKALKFVEMALFLSPNDPMLWHYLGRCNESLGKTDDSLVAYLRAVKIDPGDRYHYRRPFRLSIRKGRLKTALFLIQNALDHKAK